MSDVCPVVVIETENGPVEINKSDFDPKVHTLFEADGAAADVADPEGADAIEMMK